jgi:hypothetical protein
MIIATNPAASRFAKDVLGLKVTDEFEKAPQRAKSPKRSASTNRLGIVTARASAEEFQFIRELGIHLAAFAPYVSAIIMGRSLDDLRLMQSSNIFVTGSIKSEDIQLLIQGYDIGKLLVGPGCPLFGYPLFTAAEASGLPVAQFAWTASHPPRKTDLHVKPELPRQRAIELIAEWLIA